jgi:hypothetical protein
MSHSMKYKRLASKLGVKKFEPGALISKMHDLKGMPKKKHKQISWSTQPAQSNVMGPARRPAVTSQPMAQQRPVGLAMPKLNLANAVSGMKFKKSKKHKFGTEKGLAKPFAKKHKSESFSQWAKEEEGEKEHGGKNKKHKEVDFKKHKACMKKHKHDKSCE